MATSSLTKTFYITGKNEAKGFVDMLYSSIKNPPIPQKKVETRKLTDNDWRKLIDATLRKGR